MATATSQSAPTDPLTPGSNVVDGVTPDNAGGREEGDVELAIFRRIRSISNMSGRLAASRASSSQSSGYRRYFQHPLSMFSSDTHHHNRDASANESINIGKKTPGADAGDSEEEKESNNSQNSTEETDNPDVEQNLKRVISTGVAWRDALVQACATMLGTTIDQLQLDYNAIVSASAAPTTAFATHSATFEPTPRDLADYVIITTLKHQDALSMQNAASWLFNMMDRTGAGYVLRDEFIRYAPFIGPVADFAVAGIVFDELVREQIRLAAAAVQEKSSDAAPVQKPRFSNRRKPALSVSEASDSQTSIPSLRHRRPLPHPIVQEQQASRQAKSVSRESITAADGTLSSQGSADSTGSETPSRDLYPPSAALRFDIWRRFFHAVQDKYHYVDEDWVHVKREVGIDPDETLIKSQGALDHSDLFPTLGKLYLSQRYVIFFAAVGRNHYVMRLGAIADVTTAAIPVMMRDCMRITLESEAKAAMDGVSATVKDDSPSASSTDKAGKSQAGNRNEASQSQHIGKLMRQFTAGRKPLVFSLLEFRETKRRDNWVNLVREMTAAYRLHVQLGFGSTGRAVRGVSDSGGGDDSLSEDGSDSEVDNGSKKGNATPSVNYTRSPFRNEPSPPLLAVAAHANIVRYRALRRVTQKRVANSLLVFSRAERNPALVNWYTDSVRAYQSQSGRTWIERALAAIRENMDTNDRMYRVKDDEPFDVGKLGDAIGRFAELCSPLVRVMQFFDHLIQWRNPPATILAILVCVTIAANGLVHYVPAGLVFLQGVWVVETKVNWLGLGMGGSECEDAEQRQRNVLQLVAQVHDTLAAAQNVLSRLNRELGKVQALFLWGSHQESDSWVAVGALMVGSLILLLVPAQTLFLFGVFFMFFKHFLPPSNAALRFWQTLPSRIEVAPVKKKKSKIVLGGIGRGRSRPIALKGVVGMKSSASPATTARATPVATTDPAQVASPLR